MGEELEKPIKPECKLIGEDGNIFNLIGLATRALRKTGDRKLSKEMADRCFESRSYNECLRIISEYVEIV